MGFAVKVLGSARKSASPWIESQDDKPRFYQLKGVGFLVQIFPNQTFIVAALHENHAGVPVSRGGIGWTVQHHMQGNAVRTVNPEILLNLKTVRLIIRDPVTGIRIWPSGIVCVADNRKGYRASARASGDKKSQAK